MTRSIYSSENCIESARWVGRSKREMETGIESEPSPKGELMLSVVSGKSAYL
jgi:hypothetical protein